MADQILNMLNARQMMMSGVRRMMKNNDLHATRQAGLTSKINIGLDGLKSNKRRDQLASNRSNIDRKTSGNEIDTQALESPLMDLKSAVELFIEEYQTNQEQDYLTLKVDRLRLLDMLVKELRETTKVAKEHSESGILSTVEHAVFGGGVGSGKKPSILGAVTKLGGLAAGIGGLGFLGYKAYEGLSSGDDSNPESTLSTISEDDNSSEATADKPTSSSPPTNDADDTDTDNQDSTAPTSVSTPQDDLNKATGANLPSASPTTVARATPTTPANTVASATPSNQSTTSEDNAFQATSPEVTTSSKPDTFKVSPRVGVAQRPIPTKSQNATDSVDEDPVIRDLRYGILHSSDFGKHYQPDALNFDLSSYIKDAIIDIATVRDMEIITGNKTIKNSAKRGANDNSATGNSGTGTSGGAGANPVGSPGNSSPGSAGNLPNDPHMLPNGTAAVAGTGRTADAEKIAESHLGQDKYAVQSYLDQNKGGVNAATASWCASFINSSLHAAGIKGSGSAVANSFQTWGHGLNKDDKVQSGDVLVETRGKAAGQTGGHVGFATGKTRVGPNGQLQYQMLSGNYGGHVSENWQDASTVMARRGEQATDSMTASTQANQPPSAAVSGMSDTQADAAPIATRTDKFAEPKVAGSETNDLQKSQKKKADNASAAVTQSNTNSPGIAQVSPRVNTSISVAANSEDVDNFPFQFDETGLMYGTRM